MNFKIKNAIENIMQKKKNKQNQNFLLLCR
jgi:hypothetical protein